jgi:ligand-binding sensor domain-containing protein
MKIQKKLSFLFAYTLLWVNTTLGQQYAFQKLSLAEGLPTKDISCMLQDSRGVYWFGTEGFGLVRYDGYNFSLLTKDLPQAYLFIYSITEDPKGNLWLGTENGLLRYNGRRFKAFTSAQESPTQQILSTPTGLYSLTRSGTLFTLAGDSLVAIEAAKNVKSLAFFNDTTYLGNNNGIYSLGEGITRIDSFPVTSMSSCANFLAVAGSKGIKLKHLNGGSTKLLEHKGLRSIHCGKGILAGTDGEDWFIWENSRSIHLSEVNQLPKQNYEHVYFDGNQLLWGIGSEGLVQLGQFNWATCTTPNASAVSAIAVFKERKIAASNNQLWEVHDSSGMTPIKSPAFGTVQGLAVYNNKLFVATERGLYQYDGRQLTRVQRDALAAEFIFSIHAARDGLWLGTGNGLFRLQGELLINEGEKLELPPSTVYSISESPEGALWFGTYFNGFYRFKEGEWLTDATTALRLSTDSLQINAFTAAADDALWVASASDGLILVTPGKNFSISNNQLEFAEISSLQLHRKTLWAGSNKGLFQVYADPQRNNAFLSRKMLLTGDALGTSGNTNALYVSDETVLAGTQNGIQQLVKKDLALKGKLHLQLADVELFYGDVKGIFDFAGDTLPFLGVPAKLNLPYDLNFVNISMAGIHPYHASSLQYRYRLSGQSNGEWTNAGKRREAVFSSLKPGDYTFEAQMSIDGVEWSTPLLQYTFSIKPPYYRTWWFISVWVLCIAGITYIFVNERIKRLNQKLLLENKLINMERKALRLQMNPHFIFNALDSISSFIFKQDPKMAVRYLNNFAKLMRLTLESSMEHLHPVETEVSILKNYLELEQLRFQHKFTYTIEVDEELDFDIGIPPMLIQPHVENAILHGLKPKNGTGTITIRFILEGDFLICEIEDDGIGRKASKELGPRKDHRSMATQINKDRIRLLKEALNDDISIHIIDKFNNQNEATGTKVVIRLFAESI